MSGSMDDFFEYPGENHTIEAEMKRMYPVSMPMAIHESFWMQCPQCHYMMLKGGICTKCGYVVGLINKWNGIERRINERGVEEFIIFGPMDRMFDPPIENRKPKKEPKPKTVVVVHDDETCDCNCGDVCPNGRWGMEPRCTLKELQQLGDKIVIVRKSP